MCEIRWLIKKDGTRILQYLEDRSYHDGRGTLDVISEWKDVPVVKEDDEQDK